jgi:hypothetical protein
VARDAIPMRAPLVAPVLEPTLPDGVAVRALRADDVMALGELMYAAYAGTVDDEGQRLKTTGQKPSGRSPANTAR